MRILVSNPDTLGDMVLRQPLYSALLREGHELMLIVRASVVPLVPYVAPGVQTVILPVEVYRDDLAMHWESLSPTFQAARNFAPDVLVVAPFQWTLFEEKLAEELPGVPRIGMSGRLYRGDPHAGRSPQSRLWFNETAQVEEDLPEVEKNATLARTVLEKPIQFDAPRLFADEASLSQAEQSLRNLGLEPNGFWIAAVAGTRHVKLKQWSPQAWGRVLAHAAERFVRRFLFVGLPEERDVMEAVRLAMGDRANHAALLDAGEMGIDQLIALTSLSGGYMGHDTGPMHIAAALGKPTLAVFGGGTWPRFVPAVEPSCAIMVGVACAGCGWACGFQRPHCIQDVPVESVTQALDDLESGRIKGRECRVIPPGSALQEQMIRESAEIVRQQQREAAEIARELAIARSPDARQSPSAAEREQLFLEFAKVSNAFEARLDQLEARHALELSKVSSELSAQFTAALESDRAHEANVVENLAMRLGHLEGRLGLPRPPRRKMWPWAVSAARQFAGRTTYRPLRGPKHLPKVSVIIAAADARESTCQIIESVLGQNYPHLETLLVSVGADDRSPGCLEKVYGRIDHVLTGTDANQTDLLADAFDRATGDVIGYLAVGNLLEPGALLRVGEHFKDRQRSSAIYHEDTIRNEAWRFASDAPAYMDVYQILERPQPPAGGMFFRKSAYLAVGGIDRALKDAGMGALLLRLTRMWGLGRAHGDVISIPAAQRKDSPSSEQWEAAKAVFLAEFGLPGRIRCRLLHGFNQIRNFTMRAARSRNLFWPVDLSGKSLPPGIAPRIAAGGPISSLTGRPPDRLLFTTRDTRSRDARIHSVYYESSTGLAMAHPPLDKDAADESQDRTRSQAAGEVLPPDPKYYSPYRQFRGGNVIARNMGRVPSPWWWFRGITYHDPIVAEIVQLVEGVFAPDDPNVRFLDVGCFEGQLLDDLKSRTKWKLFGIESNSGAVELARTRGHQIWQAVAEDAPVVVPQGEAFDLIFLGRAMEHWDDPLVGLNRLKLLLAPGGAIVVALPNLDSKQVELFGPTWAHWNLPDHRTLLSRRALRRLANLAGMRVERLCTRTHAYWTTMSVQLNGVGLGGIVPPGTRFPNVIAMQGTRLTGWSRLLWDWRGRGDFMIALLRPH